MKAKDTNPRAAAFASRLAEILEELGVTKRELARRLSADQGVSFETARTNVHRLLRGDHLPTDTTRYAIADALGVDRSELSLREVATPAGVTFRDGPGSGSAASPDGRRRPRRPGEDVAA